ncbi:MULTISPECIES: hypothetical protein [unclassified Bacteroides]|jgi:hypothetical protein|uniref:hypothetical protein n=1 Tax=unclassified Bacteroides TaxID=2646097 RepID=UPI000E8BB68B|nr:MULTISPECIES: hypothetical protein [unclassified Bacteroides]RGN49993.1 hypothetical protein DXB63_05650 [Bacteroides sp. OM05-12]RHR81590.1 hypothetical protein DWW69_03435 [Bacteroides sp. AF16-49]
MKKYILLSVGVLMVLGSFAQNKNFTYKFYGQIRTDLYYNSRANEETVDGLFYMYPKDIKEDADGKDLNATANGSFYTLYTRAGLDVTGPMLGKAKTSAKIEVDFRGSGTSYSMIRLRHAYLSLDWKKSGLLLGQAWHPLYGDVAPQILNLATGAPFQPFSRAPQIRYQYKVSDVRLTAAAIWQSQYLSAGPVGKSQNYIKNSCVPEFYVGADYKKNGWLIGAGVELLSLKPRTESVMKDANGNDNTYKVDERITTLSYEVHLKYTDKDWFVAAKSLLSSNLTHTSMLGGYGIKEVDQRTGEQEYTPIRNSSTWVNVVYGQKWKPGVFLGYIKNLGTKDALVSKSLYGTGTDVDQVVTGGAELTYNLPHWKFGLEYTLCSAWYGDLNVSNGKITDTHSVRNNRVVATAIFMF